MRTPSVMFMALLATGPALAASNHSNYGIVNGYDYMPGTDVYHQNYDYGLHYDRLTSLPDTDSSPYGTPGDQGSRSKAPRSPKIKLHAARQGGVPPGAAGSSAGQATTGGDRFQNMDAELKRFRTQNLTGADPMSAGSYDALNQSLKNTLQSQGGNTNDQSGPAGLPDPYSDLNLESDLHQDLNKLHNH